MSRVIKGSSRFKSYEKPRVEERLDYAELVRGQIERCLQLSYDETLFKGSVMALESLIPEDLRDSTYRKEFELAVTTFEDFEYTYDGPIWFGTPEKPLMKLKPNGLDEYPVPYKTILDDDGKPELDERGAPLKEIDWSDPNIVSPRIVEKEEINWFKRFEAAFNQFVRMGVAVRRIPRG